MDDKGKSTEVLIEDHFYSDFRTGVEIRARILTVWADAGCQNAIKGVAGVTNVYCNLGPTQYEVFLDPRYNFDFIKAEIEAAILCREQ